MKLVLLGDSWVEGTEEGGSFVPYLRSLLPTNIYFGGTRRYKGISHEGHSGYGTDEIFANLGNWLKWQVSHPDIVLLLAGANDLPYYDAVTLANRIITLANAVRRYAPVVLVCGLPTIVGFESKISETNEILRNTVPYVDLSTTLKYPQDYVDKAHPNENGNRKLAILFANILKTIPYVQLRDIDDNNVRVGATPPTEWFAEDYQRLAQVAKEIRTSPADLLLVLWSESGLNTWAYNPKGKATGLNQITPEALRCMGTSNAEHEAMRAMTVAQQLDYVRKYFQCNEFFKTGGVYENAVQLYVANAAPVFTPAKNLNTVLYDSVKNKKQYEANKGLDHAGKGTITAGDLGIVLHNNVNQPSFKRHLQALADATG